MRFRPILFSTPMIKAILDGTKTQTRRKVKPCKKHPNKLCCSLGSYHESINFDKEKGLSWNPYSGSGKQPLTQEILEKYAKTKKGGIFWVRETFAKMFDVHPELIGNDKEDMGFWYKTDGELHEAPFYIEGHKWKPSIFMPKEACRIFLECTNVRVEKLYDISENDSKSEGVKIIENPLGYKDYMLKDESIVFLKARHSFLSLWESINGKESLDSNPWVWVYDFKVVQRPDNFI